MVIKTSLDSLNTDIPRQNIDLSYSIPNRIKVVVQSAIKRKHLLQSTIVKLNILTLHRLGDPAKTPRFLTKHVFFLKEENPNHNYFYHDTNFPIPKKLKSINFHVIVLDVTFLCIRWSEKKLYEKIKSTYSFVRESEAIKIALPQDEYDCHLILDQWMVDWNIDILYSVLPKNWDVLYPKYHNIGDIRLGFTGYLDDSLIDYNCKPFLDRSIDVGYRARRLPPYFGRIGETKWKIGFEFKKHASNSDLFLDIHVGEEHTLNGNEWLEFINNSKFTLGSNSGSSLLDPNGCIQKKVKKYLNNHPEAEFDEVEAACFPGQDGLYEFTAISPRILEASALQSGQILVEGEYSGILTPWEHYLPLKPNAENFEDIHHEIKDTANSSRRISACREAILDCPQLRYSSKANNIFDYLDEKSDEIRKIKPQRNISIIKESYEIDMAHEMKITWFFNNIKKKVKDIPIFGAFIRMFFSRRVARLSILLNRLIKIH